MRKLAFLIIIISFIVVSGLSAQNSGKKIIIEGTIIDIEKAPIANAIIIIDDKATSYVTDSSGYYKIKVRPEATRIGFFTFGNGYYEEEIGGRTKIDFNFPTKQKQNLRLAGLTLKNYELPEGEKYVDVGYGHIKQKNIITDITFIDCTEKKYERYSSVMDIIERVPGVRIMGGNVIIQGSRNMMGFVPAIIITDGVYGGSLNIPPTIVESISVLKGTAAAIYGVNGYGGVILIRTRNHIEE